MTGSGSVFPWVERAADVFGARLVRLHCRLFCYFVSWRGGIRQAFQPFDDWHQKGFRSGEVRFPAGDGHHPLIFPYELLDEWRNGLGQLLKGRRQQFHAFLERGQCRRQVVVGFLHLSHHAERHRQIRGEGVGLLEGEGAAQVHSLLGRGEGVGASAQFPQPVREVV